MTRVKILSVNVIPNIKIIQYINRKLKTLLNKHFDINMPEFYENVSSNKKVLMLLNMGSYFNDMLFFHVVNSNYFHYRRVIEDDNNLLYINAYIEGYFYQFKIIYVASDSYFKEFLKEFLKELKPVLEAYTNSEVFEEV